MTPPRILVFDSGMGGLSVAQAIIQQMPHSFLVYAADNAAFPYGAWIENELVIRILKVMRALIDEVKPDLVVVACNTASTIALAELRAAFDVPFVGTVPAIKPAAAQSKTGVIGVLATPGTVKREYTQALISDFASHCRVTLHGAPNLAELAELKLRGQGIDMEALRTEIMPAFADNTDVIVLGCTHYPLITEEIASVAPWPVTYIDPSSAIARRVGDIADVTKRQLDPPESPVDRTVILTSGMDADTGTEVAYARMGFPHLKLLNLPV
jgi:glutamate racemase